MDVGGEYGPLRASRNLRRDQSIESSSGALRKCVRHLRQIVCDLRGDVRQSVPLSGAQAVEVLDAVRPAGHRLEGESNPAGSARGTDPHMARCIQWVRACKVFLEVAQTIS